MTDKSQNQVDAFLQQMEHPLADGIRQLRSIILSADDRLEEQVKWNTQLQPKRRRLHHFKAFSAFQNTGGFPPGS